ncbi:MAG: hypothetical protein ABII80_03730, partial [bacterium]
RHFSSAAFSLLVSLCLSSWYLVPVLFERQLVQIDIIAAKTMLSDHFLSPSQLWHSPWGYGGSANLGETDGMSFMLGKFQLVLAALAIGFVISQRRWSKQISLFVVSVIVFAFASTTLSSSLWHLFPALSVVQFPWRTIVFASWGIAALVGYLLLPFRQKKLKIIVFLVCTGGLLFFNLKFFVPERYNAYRDDTVLNESALRTVVKNKIPEYLPATMPVFPTISVSDDFTHNPVKVSGQFTNLTSEPLAISTAYMPHWQLRVDGNNVNIKPTETGSIISGDIPAGTHNFNLTWHRTTVEKIGLSISAISLIIVIGLLL